MLHMGSVLKRWRENAKMKQEDLAEVTGIDKGTIGRIERSGDFKASKYEALANALGKKSIDAYIELAAVVETSKPAPSASPEAFVCDDPEHKRFHEKLEKIYLSEDQKAIIGIQANLEYMCWGATGEPPDDSLPVPAKRDDPPVFQRPRIRVRR